MIRYVVLILLAAGCLLVCGCADKRVGMQVPPEVGCAVTGNPQRCMTAPGDKVFKYVVKYTPDSGLWSALGIVRNQGEYKYGCRALVSLSFFLINRGVVTDVFTYEKFTGDSNEFSFQFHFRPEKPFDRVAFDYSISCR